MTLSGFICFICKEIERDLKDFTFIRVEGKQRPIHNKCKSKKRKTK